MSTKTWGQNEDQEISIKDLQAMVTQMRELRADYEKKKELSNLAHEEFRKAEGAVIEAMELSGQKRFSVPGLGTCSVVTKRTVTVPKDLERKRELFRYIKEEYGQETLDDYRNINHQSLNSFYKKEIERIEHQAHLEGREISNDELKIPGLDEPSEQVTTRWMSEKK